MDIFNQVTTAIQRGLNLDDAPKPSPPLATSSMPAAAPTAHTSAPLPSALDNQSKPLKPSSGQDAAEQKPVTGLPEGTKAVRLLWCDTSGVRRCRVIPAKHWARACEVGIGITKACMATPAHADCAAPESGLSAVGEVRLVPDAATLVALTYAPGHCLVLGSLFNGQVLRSSKSKGLIPWSFCPRHVLSQSAVALDKECGVSMHVGFETEFMLLRKDASNAPGGAAAAAYHGSALQGSGLVPLDGSVYAQTAAFDAASEVLDEMVEALGAAGIDVQQYHAESAPGQFEIATGPYPLAEAADKLLITREIICGVARKHGLEATLLPRPLPSAAGNGCHCHYSLFRGGKPIMQEAVRGDGAIEPHPSAEAQSFTAGVLSMVDAILPFTAPSLNSYARFKPGTWAGAFRCWGWNNREAPLRFTCPTWQPRDLEAMHVEYKAMDNCANPHMALSAIIVAGMLGLAGRAQLPEPMTVPPGEMDEAERTRRGVDALPASLSDALAVLENREGFLGAMAVVMGSEAVGAFVAVRKAEALAAVPAYRLLLRYS